MTLPKVEKNGVACSSRLGWYRRENLPCLRKLRFANRGFVERVMEVIWDLQVDKSGFRCFDFNSEELAYQLEADETEIKTFLLDRRTIEALELARTYMELQYFSGVSLMTNSVTTAKQPSPEEKDDFLDEDLPTPPDSNPPAPKPIPPEKPSKWSDNNWDEIYLSARTEFEKVWSNTLPGVVIELKKWVAILAGLKDPKDVKKEHREEWIPKILSTLRLAEDEAATYTSFKKWMESGAAEQVKTATCRKVKRIGWEEVPVGAHQITDPDVLRDAEQYEIEKQMAEAE